MEVVGSQRFQSCLSIIPLRGQVFMWMHWTSLCKATETHTVCKRAVRILLESFFVVSEFKGFNESIKGKLK